MYTLGIRIFSALLYLASFFNAKARRWVEGRRNWRSRYRKRWQVPSDARVLWVHAASLGEFEQGRPLIEAFRTQYPDWKIVLTFFSPSGYEIRKNYAGADWVAYLPADTLANARDFLDILRPSMAIFVKYEFWANYLSELKRRDTPTLLVSALFRQKQPFFQWYGAHWRRMLECFSHIFVQNQDSLNLLIRHGFEKAALAGDTRIDRSLALPGTAPENSVAAAFAAEPNRFTLIAGSTWAADEAVLIPLPADPAFANWKMVIAPHEPSAEHVHRLEKQIHAVSPEVNILRYSKADPETARSARVLIIDNIGMLNSLYRYGYAAYIGGGFGKGIHNTLEPAAYGLPVLFGPKFEKFEEARQMAAQGGAFPCNNTNDIKTVLHQLEHPDHRQRASAAVLNFLYTNKGATEKIMAFMDEGRG